MGPGHLEKVLSAIKYLITTWLIISGLVLIGIYWLLAYKTDLSEFTVLAAVIGIWVISAVIIGAIIAHSVSKPLKAISLAILHISPSALPTAAPEIEKLTIGRELIANLTRQVYDFASHGAAAATEAAQNQSTLLLQQIPVPIMCLDEQLNVTFANVKANELAKQPDGLEGKNLYTVFDVLFRDATPLEQWIKENENSIVTAQKMWHGVRFNPFNDKTQYYDLAASYNQKSDSSATQTIIALFEQTEVYSEDDNSISFIALAVHELRTPLTILRGYIEVLEDEMSANATDEQIQFITRMQESAENLTAYVGNILNVAKVQENELKLKLTEKNWNETLSRIIKDLQLKAGAHGKNITLSIDPNLPTVGIDSVSIAEVITNLIDNAIKYSPEDKTEIVVQSKLKEDGTIETTIQDFGVGIPTQVMPHLFEKFSRNYRNKANFAGTGLGLYLSKALVNAHGGNIWVRSKEGQGSIFGFTILPYDKAVQFEQNKTKDPHQGWIKNHSLARR